ncbi:hypothetical protein MKW98_017000, partial [Papaver atlanticum]
FLKKVAVEKVSHTDSMLFLDWNKKLKQASKKLVNRCSATIGGHNDVVITVVFSLDGTKQATGSGDTSDLVGGVTAPEAGVYTSREGVGDMLMEFSDNHP